MIKFRIHRILMVILIRLARKYRRQALALHIIRYLKPGQFHQRRRQIHQFHQRIGFYPFQYSGRAGNNQRNMGQRLIKIRPFPIQSVIPVHLPVIAHINNERIIPLPRHIQIIHQPSELIIYQFNLRIIIPEMLSFFLIAQFRERLCLPVLASLIKVLLLMRRLIVQFPFFPKGKRHILHLQPVLVFLRRIQRRMGVIGIQADQPRIPFPPIFFHEFNGLLHAPCCLMILRRNTHCLAREIRVGRRRPSGHTGVFSTINISPFQPLFLQPVLIIIFPIQPVIIGMFAPLHVAVPVIGTLFHPALCGSQMKFPGKAADISFFRKQLRYQLFILRIIIISVIKCFCSLRISSCEKTGTAGRAYRRLCICPGKCHSFRYKFIYIRCLNVRIPKTAYRIPPLLIRTKPHNI